MSTGPKFRVICDIAAGRRNTSDQKDCEDVVAYQRSESQGWIVVALADGAGSAENAREGAQISAITTIEAVKYNHKEIYAMNDDLAIKFILTEVIERLGQAAKEKQQPLKSFASTLLFIVIVKDRFLLGQLGDGRIAVLKSQADQWDSAFSPVKGEFHNETIFTVSSNAQQLIKSREEPVDDIMGCVLMSDGAEESLFERETGKFSAAIDTFYVWLTGKNGRKQIKRALSQALQGPMKEKTFDDLSVAIMVKIPGK